MNAPAGSIREFIGREGIAALSRTGTDVDPTGAASFRARVAVVPLGRTRISAMEATAHRGFSSGALRSDSILFHFLLAGRFSAYQDGQPERAEIGSIRFLGAGASFRYNAESPSYTVAWWLKLDLLRPAVAEALRNVVTLEFRDDVTARSATAVIRSLARNPPEPGSRAAFSLEDVLIAQIEAVVMAADAYRLDPRSADRNLYGEVRALFAADLSRRSLAWNDLARELGTSPALLSRALAAQGTTARELLVRMRLDELASLLRDPQYGGSLTEAVTHSGFAGLAQAARAFRAEYGTTMGRYRALSRGE